MNLKKQSLSSPYYPDENYFAHLLGCEWLITAPEGKIILLEFHHFSVRKNLIQNRNFHLLQ